MLSDKATHYLVNHSKLCVCLQNDVTPLDKVLLVSMIDVLDVEIGEALLLDASRKVAHEEIGPQIDESLA